MFVKKDEYIKPEIMIIKFGCEDIMSASTEDNTDPWIPDPFES